MKRILIWFTNGLYREFPRCTSINFDRDNKLVDVVFGHDHYAIINMNNINFYEILDEKED